MLYDPKWEVKLKAPMIESWRQVLLDAADLLEREGHCKGQFYIEGARCAVGAICGITKDAFTKPMEDSVSQAIGRLCHAVGPYIPDWNDAPDRTAAEVIATMREVAAKR